MVMVMEMDTAAGLRVTYIVLFMFRQIRHQSDEQVDSQVADTLKV